MTDRLSALAVEIDNAKVALAALGGERRRLIVERSQAGESVESLATVSGLEAKVIEYIIDRETNPNLNTTSAARRLGIGGGEFLKRAIAADLRPVDGARWTPEQIDSLRLV